MSVTAMQNFRGVLGVNPHDAAFGEMDVQGTGLIDMNELADALRVMGKSERDIQQLLKDLVVPSPSTVFSQRRRAYAYGRFESYCTGNAKGTSSQIEVTSVLARRTVPLAPQRSLPLQIP